MRAALSGLSIITIAFALSACERNVQLHLATDVRQASEMEAVLSSHGIETERKPEKTGVMLSVADSDLTRAMRALHEAGLLRPIRPSVDEALGKRAIAPTPLEERARHVHAIERALEATLMDIDGVTAARVRVVTPERPSPGAPLTPASASVLLKHRAGVDLTPLMPGIARLVKNGAPGLADEDDRRVTVLLVPEQPMVAAAGVAGKGESRSTPWLIGLACGSVAIGYFADRARRRLLRPRSNEGRSEGNGKGNGNRQSKGERTASNAGAGPASTHG